MPTPTPTSFLLTGGMVLPMEGRRVALDPGAVLVLDGRIAAVDTPEALSHHPAVTGGVEVIDRTGHAVIPGLHNAHLHSGLLRGTAENLEVWEWLQVHVDPAHRALTAPIAEAASWMAYTEGLRFGTTSVLDMWRFMDGAARAADTLGIRATLAPYMADRYDWFESLASNRRLLEEHRSSAEGRVRAWIGLEHLFYCSEEMFRASAAMAEEFDTRIHVHCSESSFEVGECERLYGRRPVAEIAHRGVLDGRTVVAHGVWLDDDEVDVLARTNTPVSHCPISNMKLSSGAARIGYYRAHGVTVGIGSDGEKENNTLDIFEEMKVAALLQKVTTMDPTTGDPWDILDMATLSGARLLGLDHETGSLEVGKDADIVTVDLRGVHFVPVLHGKHFNVPTHLVFTARGHDVADVWVRGRQLVTGGEVLTVDVAAVTERAQAAAEELFARRDALAPLT